MRQLQLEEEYNISIIFLRLVCGQKTTLPFTNDPSKSCMHSDSERYKLPLRIDDTKFGRMMITSK